MAAVETAGRPVLMLSLRFVFKVYANFWSTVAFPHDKQGKLKLKIDIRENETQVEAMFLLASQNSILTHKESDIACLHSSCNLTPTCGGSRLLSLGGTGNRMQFSVIFMGMSVSLCRQRLEGSNIFFVR